METPALVPVPGMEVHLQGFRSRFRPHLGPGEARDLWLRTSPELALKRLLVAGAGPVPLGVAAGAWSTVSSGLTDTAASISRVMADLRTGWSGEAADAALSKFAPFQEWAAAAALPGANCSHVPANTETNTAQTGRK